MDLGRLTKRFLQQLPAYKLHAGEVEGAFPQIALERDGDGPVPVQVPKPLAVLRVGKLGVSPIVNLLMPFCILLISGEQPGEQRGDDRLVVRPPEFHVVPILLHWLAM